MAWTSPITAVQGQQVTANMFNKQVRDNLLETAPAKATEEGMIFTDAGSKSIDAKLVASDFKADEVTRSSSHYGDPSGGDGPQVVVTVHKSMILWASCRIWNSSGDALSAMSFEVKGRTDEKPRDLWAVLNDGVEAGGSERYGVQYRETDMKSGDYVITCKYRAGGLGTAHFADRELIVLPL